MTVKNKRLPKSTASREHFPGAERRMHTYRQRRPNTCRPAPDELHWVIVNVLLGASPETRRPEQRSGLPCSQGAVRDTEMRGLGLSAQRWHRESRPGSAASDLPWLDLKVYLFHCASSYRGALALGYREKDAVLYTTVNLQGDLSCSAEVCFFRLVLSVCEDVLRQDLQKACSMSLWFCYHKQEPSQDHQVLSCTRPFRHFTARFMAV